MTARWYDEESRWILKHAAAEAYHDQRWETAARLYYDAQTARGIKSRKALSRALRAAKLAPQDVARWLTKADEIMAQTTCDNDEYARRLAVNPELRRQHFEITGQRITPPRDTRSPIERMIDAATGYDGGKRGAP